MVSKNQDRIYLYDASSQYVDIVSCNSKLSCNHRTFAYDAIPFDKQRISWDRLSDYIVARIQFWDRFGVVVLLEELVVEFLAETQTALQRRKLKTIQVNKKYSKSWMEIL